MLSALTVVEPPAAPLLPIDLVRRHIRIDTSDEDDLLELYLGAATEQAEAFLGRALLTQTFTWVAARTAPPEQFPMVPFTAFILPLWMPYSMLFQRPFELPRAPVQAVTQVQLGEWGQPDTVLDPSTYYVDTETEPGRLQLQQGTGYPSDHLSVTFTAGYGDTAASVPKAIQQAVLLMTAFLYENRGDAGGDMPPAAEALLWPRKLQFFGG